MFQISFTLAGRLHIERFLDGSEAVKAWELITGSRYVSEARISFDGEILRSYTAELKGESC